MNREAMLYVPRHTLTGNTDLGNRTIEYVHFSYGLFNYFALSLPHFSTFNHWHLHFSGLEQFYNFRYNLNKNISTILTGSINNLRFHNVNQPLD